MNDNHKPNPPHDPHGESVVADEPPNHTDKQPDYDVGSKQNESDQIYQNLRFISTELNCDIILYNWDMNITGYTTLKYEIMRHYIDDEKMKGHIVDAMKLDIGDVDKKIERMEEEQQRHISLADLNAIYPGQFSTAFMQCEQYFLQQVMKSLVGTEQVLLVLITRGGDAHFAFKCARFLQHIYGGGFRVYVPSYCKSAGTLVCLGANSIFFVRTGRTRPT